MKTRRVKVDDSSIHGLGVFATEDIDEGTVIGIVTGTILESPDPDSKYLFWFEDDYENYYGLEPFEPFKYLNHSPTPNADWSSPVLIAERDIDEGEEITINYGEEFENELHGGTEDDVSLRSTTSEPSGLPNP